MNESSKSPLAPFKHRTFAVMWSAALFSNIGIWMHSVGASWLMTSLSPSPLVVSLVQAAATLPVFLFALPAGALADIFNKRTLLIITNIIKLILAGLFAYFVWSENMSANLLLTFTFLLGVCGAFMAPAWQAIVPSLVPKDDLPQAVALGGISINISRAIGPALAGFLISLYGLAMPFIANTASFVVVLGALFWWSGILQKKEMSLPPERVWSAIKVGVRYALHSAPLKSTIWHVVGFMFFANAYWGLLPVISKDLLKGDASYFGTLMGSIGIGAVLGALILPRLKQRFSANQLVAIGTIGTASITAYFAIAQSQTIAVAISLVFGISWILVLASVNLSAQQALPDWVRARGLAVFMMMFFGSMTLGISFWGWVATQTSIQTSMLIAAGGGLLFIVFSFRSKLQQGKDIDFTASHHWPEPRTFDGVEYSDGPVLIQVTYQVEQSDKDAFLKSVFDLRSERLADGVFDWSIYQDTENEQHFIEVFKEQSWVQHLRHHEHVSNAYKAIQEKVLQFHQGNAKPSVKHFIANHQKRN